MRRIVWATERQWLAIHIVNEMIKKWILSENHTYTKTLINITKEIDEIWKIEIAKLDQKIQQEREKQQQYKKLTEMLQSFKK